MKIRKKTPSLKQVKPIKGNPPFRRKAKVVKTIRGSLCDLSMCDVIELMFEEAMRKMENTTSGGPPSGGSSQRGMETPNGNPEKPRKRRLLRGGSV